MTSPAAAIESPPAEPDGANKIRVELAVNIKLVDDLERIDEALRGKGARIVATNLEDKTIQLELEHSGDTSDVQSLQRSIEDETGIVTVVKGLGQLGTAVAELKPSTHLESKGVRVMGVVRLSQLEGGRCFVDGLLDGFNEYSRRSAVHSYSLAVHEFGDMSSDNLDSIGDILTKLSENHTIDSDRVSVSTIVTDCDVSSMIGRSVAVSNKDKDILSAGVVARASTIGANKKQICSCSGKTLWEERLDQKRG